MSEPYFTPYPSTVGNNDTRTALRDALIVAMVQADVISRAGFNKWFAAGTAIEYVETANKIASTAYPEDP